MRDDTIAALTTTTSPDSSSAQAAARPSLLTRSARAARARVPAALEPGREQHGDICRSLARIVF